MPGDIAPHANKLWTAEVAGGNGVFGNEVWVSVDADGVIAAFRQLIQDFIPVFIPCAGPTAFEL